VTGRWFSPDTPPSATKKKPDRHDIAEIMLKMALNTINPPYSIYLFIQPLLISPSYYKFTLYSVMLRKNLELTLSIKEKLKCKR
jgi:hypothetical protein